MTDENKKLLTKYLGERWRDKTVEDVFEWQDNRTFTSRADMMDLYDRLFQKHKWHKFTVFAKTRFSFNDYNQTFTNIETGFYAWVFCLDGDGYEDRCQI